MIVHTMAKIARIQVFRLSGPFFLLTVSVVLLIGFCEFIGLAINLVKGTLLQLLPKLRERFFYTSGVGKTQSGNPWF